MALDSVEVAPFDYTPRDRGGLSREVTENVDLASDQESRRRRFKRRSRARSIESHIDRQGGESTFPRIRTCGFTGNDLQEIKIRDGHAYAAKTLACGLIWVCAWCSAKIRIRRAKEVEQAASQWVASGGTLAMLSLTVRHSREMSLRDVLSGLLGSYRRLQPRKSFEVLRSMTVGRIKALEVTYGENGWHPHLHLLLFVKPVIEESDLRECMASMTTDWRQLVEASLGVAPSVLRGLDLQWFGSDASVAGYVSKIAKEISMADSKSGLDPFALLDVMDVGRDRAVARFIEYVDEMRKHHAMDWSPGLRDRFELGDLKSDEEVANDDDDLGDPVAWTLFGWEWNFLLSQGRASGYLESVERLYREVSRE